jgi:hypothetical protein
MALKKFDRVQETVTGTPGTGTITLGGAVSGFRTFGAVLANGDDFPYAILDGTAWETGVGTWATGGTMTRRLKDSSTGSLISLTSAAVVFMSPIAFLDRANVTYNNTGTQTVGAGWTGATNSTKLNACDNDAELYTEVATGAATIDINFTGLGDITHIIARVRYLDGAGTSHTMMVKAYDYNAVAFSASLYTINDTKDFDYIVIELDNDQRANFKNGSGAAIVRFEHSAGLVAGHLFSLDYCVFKFNAGLNESTADPVSSRLIATRLLTSGTSYTPTVGTAFAIIKGVAGGGGSSGATAVASGNCCGGGGASGGEFEHQFPVTAAQSCTYALGAAGTAGTATSSGGAGGNTTFAVPITDAADIATITAYGGIGSVYTVGTTAVSSRRGGLAGAIGTNALVNKSGQFGQSGGAMTATTGHSGCGGGSMFGPGGLNRTAAGAGQAAGATAYGAGAGGACSLSATGVAGAAGIAGAILVYEYS